MGFLETPSENDDGNSSIVFLYKLVPGIATRSYGLNVAKLARLPEEVLTLANTKAHDAEEKSESRVLEGLAKRFKEAWRELGAAV